MDFRFAFRQLLKSPGFAAVAIATLALGIGANTAIFSVIHAVLLRPLPFKESDRLVWVEEISRGSRQEAWGGHFLDWQERGRTIEGIAAYDGATQTLSGEGAAERVEVGLLSAGFLPLLGVHPLPPGRHFHPSEDRPGGERVAILSHAFWQRRYQGDPDISGRTITLNDATYSVIGVMPAGFRFFGQFDVWVPLVLDARAELAGETRYFGPTLARLKPGVSLAQAEVEMDTLLQQYEASRPQGSSRIESRTQLTPLRTHLLGESRRPLLVLLGAVALVLVIASANVANLMLARAMTRQRELAIRTALGAGRARLARQLMTECLLLTLAGGTAGVMLASWLTSLLGALCSTGVLGEMGRLAVIAIDWHVLGFALGLSILTGLVFGLLQALHPPHLNLSATLKKGGRGSPAIGHRLRAILMVGEVALAIVLLAGAGLLIRSFVRLMHVDPGYHAESLLTARFQLPPRYSEPLQRVQFYEQLLQRVAALPGVLSAGATSHLPLIRYNMGATLHLEERVPEPGTSEPSAPIASVDSAYFRTMGIRLIAGRFFDDGDRQAAPSVALLSDALARKLFPNENPLGRRLRVGVFGDAWTTIVGVTSDIRHQGLDQGREEAVYLHYRQLPRPGMALVLRSAGDPLILASALRQAVREIDPGLPLYEVMTMEARLSQSVAGRRLNLVLLATFAALALLLSGIGVYGVIACIVSSRTQEVGIRMALGAGRGEVIAMVLGQGLSLAGIGIALGVPAAFGLTRVLRSLLFEVTPGDPVTFVAVLVTLLLVTLLASWLPARRAARVDPVVALRSE